MGLKVNPCWFVSKVCKQHTYTHPFNGPFSGTTQVSRYQKGKTNLDFTEARDSEWQWHQLGHMQVSTMLQTDNHISTPPLSFLQAGCPSCRPTNSVKALKEFLSQSMQQKLHSSCFKAAWRNNYTQTTLLASWNRPSFQSCSSSVQVS